MPRTKRQFLDRAERDRRWARAKARVLAQGAELALEGYFAPDIAFAWADLSARQWSLERRNADLDPLALQPGLAGIRGRRLGAVVESPPSELARQAALCLHRHVRLRHIQQARHAHLGGSLVHLDLDAWEAHARATHLGCRPPFGQAPWSIPEPAIVLDARDAADATIVQKPLVRSYADRIAPPLSEMVGTAYQILRPLFMSKGHLALGEFDDRGDRGRSGAWTVDALSNLLADLINAHWGHVIGEVEPSAVNSAFHRVLHKDRELRANAHETGDRALRDRRSKRA